MPTLIPLPPTANSLLLLIPLDLEARHDRTVEDDERREASQRRSRPVDDHMLRDRVPLAAELERRRQDRIVVTAGVVQRWITSRIGWISYREIRRSIRK